MKLIWISISRHFKAGTRIYYIKWHQHLHHYDIDITLWYYLQLPLIWTEDKEYLKTYHTPIKLFETIRNSNSTVIDICSVFQNSTAEFNSESETTLLFHINFPRFKRRPMHDISRWQTINSHHYSRKKILMKLQI